MRTVSADFSVHSLHGYFVLAGDAEYPIVYHVERVRDGRSFATRVVHVKQRGRPIFMTMLSFSRVDSGGDKRLEHATPMPPFLSPDDKVELAVGGPFELRKVATLNRMYLFSLSFSLFVIRHSLKQIPSIR